MYQNCYIMHTFPSLFRSSISSVLKIAASMFIYEYWLMWPTSMQLQNVECVEIYLSIPYAP